MRDVATHDQLTEKLRAAAKENPTVKLRPSEGPDPTKVNRPESIVKSSDFLSFAGRATLVPKRAILHVPANMADRVKFVSGNQLMPFGDFFAMNRGWVTTFEVTRAQAEGNQPLPEDVIKRFQKSSNLVVAVFKGGPISVLPLKTPPDATATAGAKTPATPAPKKP